ncbi:MAG: Ig-like domain-containing protein [Patescibacteria group bacterium]|mgnify:CR=1 FL=1
MKKVFLLLSIVLALVAIPATVFLAGQSQELRKKAAPATSLSLSPSNMTKKVGDTFTLETLIDTGNNQVVAAELHVIFDPQKLEAQTITNGPLFPSILVSGVVERGSVSITIGAANSRTPITGTGTAAVIKFIALEKTDGPIQIRLAQNTFVGSLGEGSTNVLTGSTPANITITGDSAAAKLAPANTNNSASSSATPSPKPSLSLTPTPQASGSAVASPSGSLKITTTFSDGKTTDDTPTIQGKAPPGSTVTITIHSSNPQTVVVTADANGNWVYTTATPLESGTHNVIVSATDPTTGKQLTSTSTFVVASGANETATQSAMPISGDISTTYIILILGSLLLLGGLFYPTTTRAYGKYS